MNAEQAFEELEKFEPRERAEFLRWLETKHPTVHGEVVGLLSGVIKNDSLTDYGSEDFHIDGYQIIGKIGSGGMGTVFEAEQVSLKRRVAIKIPPQKVLDDPVKRERFKRESSVLASLSHPNIVKVIDRGEINGIPYYVMEKIRGSTLSCPVSDPAKMMREILDAISYMHGRSVIHRDIKPANILIDDSGHVVLCDFGIAFSSNPLVDRATKDASSGVGTYVYASPEQVDGREIDERADIFSCGVLFHEMVTGYLPIGDIGSVPFDQVIRKAMARNRLDRFQTATEFQQAIVRSESLAIPDADKAMIENAAKKAAMYYYSPRAFLIDRSPIVVVFVLYYLLLSPIGNLSLPIGVHTLIVCCYIFGFFKVLSMTWDWTASRVQKKMTDIFLSQYEVDSLKRRSMCDVVIEKKVNISSFIMAAPYSHLHVSLKSRTVSLNT